MWETNAKVPRWVGGLRKVPKKGIRGRKMGIRAKQKRTWWGNALGGGEFKYRLQPG